MALNVGDRLGHYDVTALIGEGGMGQVYRATDTKLDRDVALKILPDAFVNDPERLARFQREAKVLASLNHPNIAAIYGLEESGDSPALVLEYVEGPTLQDRIAKGPIPLDEALPIARQIAEALEAAHEQGIIHRDLKPANVKVKDDGTVKVLDFGLAKALQPDLSDLDAANSPTMTAVATKVGVVMGTAAYMSPEQAAGKSLDTRTDIWSFGTVLYEMLTGRKTFIGDNLAAMLVSITREAPVWSALPDETPVSVQQALRVCLQKDAKRRVRDISAVRLVMEGAFEITAVTPSTPTAVPPLPAWQRPVPIAVALSLIVGIAVWGLVRSGPVPPSPTSRVVISVPPSRPVAPHSSQSDVAISPDGRWIVYQTAATGGLDVRSLDQLASVNLRAAETAAGPFMSPDGEWVGFQSASVSALPGNLQRVSISGGPPVTICVLPGPLRGTSWGRDDVIIFGIAGTQGLWRVSATGGEPTVVTEPVVGEMHQFPELLPNGAGALFVLGSNATTTTDDRIAVLDRTTGEHRVIVENGSSPRYAESGHIVYAVEGSLYAVAFDQQTLEVTGNPVPVIEDVLTKDSGAWGFDLSDTGDLVYVAAAAGGGEQRTFVWVEPDGLEEPLSLPARPYLDPRVSPDARRIAVVLSGDDEQDLWVYDVVTGAGLRLTNGFTIRQLVWTPDGTRIIFASAHEGTANIYSLLADGSGQSEVVLASEEADFPASVTPDGRAVAFTRLPEGPGTPRREIWEVPLEGGGPAVPLVQGGFGLGSAEYSPDGNWLAYRSDQSGEMEVYVQPYPGPGAVVPASIGGGDHVMWSVDGSRLFYRLDDQMMATRFDPGDPARIGSPSTVFEGAYYDQPRSIRQHHLAPDGRFLMMKDAPVGPSDRQVPAQVVLIQNWTQELLERVPIP